MGKTFDKLDQKNTNDLEEELKSGALKTAPGEVQMSNRDIFLTNLMIQFQTRQQKILNILEPENTNDS